MEIRSRVFESQRVEFAHCHGYWLLQQLALPCKPWLCAQFWPIANNCYSLCDRKVM